MRFTSPNPGLGPCGVHGRHALCGTSTARFHGFERSFGRLRPAGLFALFLAIALGASTAPVDAQQSGRSGAWAIEGTTIIDGRGGEPLTDAVIIVDRGVIRCVGSRSRCPLFGIASVIDGTDLWVTPAMIDPDVTLRWSQDSVAVQDAQHVRLAVGITLVREAGTGGEVETNLRARSRAADPFRPEPRILVTGPVDPASAREVQADGLVGAARQLARRSVDGLRVTGAEEASTLDSIFRIARAWSIPVYGANPGASLANEQVVALAERGVRVVGAPEAVSAGSGETLDSLAERSVALEPRLTSVHFDGNTPPHIEELRFLDGPRPVLDFLPFLGTSDERRLAESAENADTSYQKAVEVLTRFREQGGTVLAASGDSRPGSGLLTELEFLQDAGFPPADLVSLVTYGAARELGVSRRYGSIRPGLAADLLLLEADPTVDIRNVREVWRVAKGGVIYDPEQLLEPFRVRYERETKLAWKQRAIDAKWFAVAGLALMALWWYRRKNAWRF